MINLPPPILDTEPLIAPYVQAKEQDATPKAFVVGNQWVADPEEHRVIEGNGTTCFMFYRPFPTRNPLWSDTSLQSAKNQEAILADPVDTASGEAIKTRDLRLALLARKYASKEFPDEDRARLEIVTTRLRKMIPRVKAADFEALEKVAQETKAAQEKRLAVMRKLGLGQ